MSSSAKQILHFLSAALIMIVAIVGVSVHLANGYIQSQQQLTSSNISQTSIIIAEQDTKAFAKQIKALSNFSKLSVQALSGEQLYMHKDNNANVFPLLTNDSIELDLTERQIKVSYQLNVSDLSQLLVNLTLILSFIALALFVLLLLIRRIAANRGEAAVAQQLAEQFTAAIDNVGTGSTNALSHPQLTQALKKLEEQLKKSTATAQSLESVAYVDELTKLPNRSKFVHFIEHNQPENADVIKFGVLLITRCSELQTINQIHGYQEGDRYISHVAGIVQKQLHTIDGGQIFRLNSSDFACLLPNITLNEAEKFAEQLTAKFNEYQLGSELDSVAFTGLVKFEADKPLGELLALADTAISVAQTLHKNAWYVQKDASILASSSASYGNQNWRQEIDNVITNQKVKLLVQPIQPSQKGSRIYGEILARFLNEDNDMLPTAPFIAMAEKLDKIIAVDRMIIEIAMREIASHHMPEQRFGINVSARSIHDEHFLIWLERKLLKENDVAPRIIFEISEFGIQQNIKTGKRFIDMVHRVGAKVSVERFGVGLTSFKFFKDLKPDFIKMDGSYTRNIDEDKNNQYFLRLMIDLAHRLSVKVLAESVETPEEKDAIDRLLFDGCQGYFIGKPEAL